MTFVLLTFATLLTWEMLRAALPFKLPALAHTVLVVALAYGWSYVPVEWLTLAACASGVGLLDGFVGGSDGQKSGLHLSMPHRRVSKKYRKRIPDLPYA